MDNGELNDDQLDNVSGGLEVVKLGKITVVGKREEADAKLTPVKLDKVVVTGSKTQKT